MCLYVKEWTVYWRDGADVISFWYVNGDSVYTFCSSTWVWIFTQKYNIPFCFSTWVWIFTQTYNIRIKYVYYMKTFWIRIIYVYITFWVPLRYDSKRFDLITIFPPTLHVTLTIVAFYYFPFDPSYDIGHRCLLPLLVLDPFQVIFIDVPFSLRTRIHSIYIHKHRDRKFTCESFYILTIGFLFYFHSHSYSSHPIGYSLTDWIDVQCSTETYKIFSSFKKFSSQHDVCMYVEIISYIVHR